MNHENWTANFEKNGLSPRLFLRRLQNSALQCLLPKMFETCSSEKVFGTSVCVIQRPMVVRRVCCTETAR